MGKDEKCAGRFSKNFPGDAMPPVNGRHRCKVIGIDIDVLSWGETCEKIFSWAYKRESRYVCICNVHSVVSGAIEETFGKVLKGADMATPDGAPIAWMLRRLGHGEQRRINGPDLMQLCCEHASRNGSRVFFYGGSQDTLNRLQKNFVEAFPALNIAGTFAPPFRPLTPEEDGDAINLINGSGAEIVFVGIGCPKQELWMAQHRGQVRGVMIGVGAAFDYHAGTCRRAPKWMQTYGLEWLYRLISEPRRLWKRYLYTNTLFIVMATKQLIYRRQV